MSEKRSKITCIIKTSQRQKKKEKSNLIYTCMLSRKLTIWLNCLQVYCHPSPRLLAYKNHASEMLLGCNERAFELMNSERAKLFIMSSCSKHMLEPEKHLWLNPCLLYYQRRCCDRDFISSFFFFQLLPISGSMTLIFSLSSRPQWRKRGWEVRLLFPWGATIRQFALWKESVSCLLKRCDSDAFYFFPWRLSNVS